jgi:hypothetical protein
MLSSGVNPIVAEWQRLLERDELVVSDAVGSGAIENMRALSIPSSASVAPEELASVFQQVLARRRSLAASVRFPVTFYLWHDEMAGQLRFSTAHCTLGTLPFSASLDLLEDPRIVLTDFLGSSYRDDIPWEHLTESSSATNTEDAPLPRLKVWAVPLNDVTTMRCPTE